MGSRTSTTSTQACSSCESSPSPRSFRDLCHPDASNASGGPGLKTHFAIIAAVLIGAPALLSAQPTPPTRDYLVLVASGSVDRVALIRFGPNGAKVEKERYVGWAPTEVAGPHGLAVSPDKKHYFVSTAHGTPFGRLTKYNAETNAAEGNVMLGNFPATAQV